MAFAPGVYTEYPDRVFELARFGINRLASMPLGSDRQLESQMDAAHFERILRSPVNVSPAARQIDSRTESFFKDAYMLEFVNLPADHTEGNLHGGLLLKLKEFLIELGRDFCFVGSEYPVGLKNEILR